MLLIVHGSLIAKRDGSFDAEKAVKEALWPFCSPFLLFNSNFILSSRSPTPTIDFGNK